MPSVYVVSYIFLISWISWLILHGRKDIEVVIILLNVHLNSIIHAFCYYVSI